MRFSLLLFPRTLFAFGFHLFLTPTIGSRVGVGCLLLFFLCIVSFPSRIPSISLPYSFVGSPIRAWSESTRRGPWSFRGFSFVVLLPTKPSVLRVGSSSPIVAVPLVRVCHVRLVILIGGSLWPSPCWRILLVFEFLPFAAIRTKRTKIIGESPHVRYGTPQNVGVVDEQAAPYHPLINKRVLSESPSFSYLHLRFQGIAPTVSDRYRSLLRHRRR